VPDLSVRPYMREDPLASEKAVIIADEDEALKIITRLGVFDKLSQSVALGQRTAVFHKIHWHTRFWILVGRYHGFDRPEDNGWMVGIWPKSRFSADEMDRYIITTAQDVCEVIDLTDSETRN
jgi:hypothetical protein